MKKRSKNTLITLIIVLVGLFINSFFNTTEATSNNVKLKGDNLLTVHYLDVGQGDSIFIELPNDQVMLIDASEKDMSSRISNYIRKKGYSKLDYLIATHPHSDHIGGMKDIVNNFDLKSIYMPKAVTTTKTYENLLKSISDKGMKIKSAKSGMKIIAEKDLLVEILAPNSETYESLNNYSVVLKVTYKNRSFIFMGDAERLSEEEITSSPAADVIKIGHHGSSSSTSAAFLKKVNPSMAIISVGQDNSYNHPHTSVINRLEKSNIKVYRTDLNGNIVLTTDGNEIKVEVDK